MLDVIVLFVDICLFKRGPQDVPASWFLFGLVLIAYLIVGELLLMVESDWLEAGMQALTEAGLLLIFCWVILYFTGKTPRFLQTTIALLGTDAIISTPGALLLQWWVAHPEMRLFQTALFALMLWHIAVLAHILRHALSRPLVYGAALALLYILVTYQLMSMIFSPAAAA